MPTPVEKIINTFYSKFQSKVELDEGLVYQFLLSSAAEFSADLYPLSTFEDEYYIDQDLNMAEIELLGALMYKQYLHREKDKVLKLNNIVGRDIKLTSMGNSKYAMNTAYKDLLDEIAIKIDKLKPMVFD